MKTKITKPLNENQWFVNIILVTVVFIPIFITVFFVLGLILYLSKLKQTKLLEDNSFFLVIYSWINVVFSLSLVLIAYLAYGLSFEPTYILTAIYPIVSVTLLFISMKYHRNHKSGREVLK